jgi:hypothetical protein
MAKQKVRRAVSEGYFGILFFTLLAMLGAVGMIAYELNEEYSWEAEPKAMAIPKASPVPFKKIAAEPGVPDSGATTMP